jgi:translocation and assembly module TamA
MFVYSSIFAEKPSTFNITGCSGKALKNVKKRLIELEQIKPLTRLSTQELNDQISEALKPFGYFASTVEIHKINDVKIQINIQKGPQVRISAVQIKLVGAGANQLKLLTIIKKSAVQVGNPLATEKYNKLKVQLTNAAEQLGYLHSKFLKAEVLIEVVSSSAQINMIFDTGPLFYFGQIKFSPSNISPDLMHRFVPFHPGEYYSIDKLLKFDNYLSNSGYFSSVLVQPQIGEGVDVPVIVHVEPIPKYTYSLGLGYGTDTGIRGRASLNVIPVNKWGHKFNAVAQGSLVQNVLQAQYQIPGTNPITDQFDITGNFSNLNYTAGSGNALLASLMHQHKTPNFNRNLSLNGLFEAFNYTLQPNRKEFMIYPKATFSFIKKDSPLFTPSGYNITLNGLGSDRLLGSNINVLQTSIDARIAYTIEPWRLRLYGHSFNGITAMNDINRLPLSLALLLGGADNLKGYSFNSIGPGKIVNYGGFEIQKETVKNWYLVGFFDAGNSYNPTPKNIKYDIGAAIMWVSPIGPIKIGLAQPVDNDLNRTSSYPRLVINMGPNL